MILEKKILDNEFLRWPGVIPVEYLYTSGVAGEKFFRELKNNQRLLGTYCSKCRKNYLPPRFYCERCFQQLTKWRPIPRAGKIHTFTVVETDPSNNPLPQPVIIGLITFKGIEGGLIHKIGEAQVEEIKIGQAVVPVFEDRKNRKGGILDIKYFRPS